MIGTIFPTLGKVRRHVATHPIALEASNRIVASHHPRHDQRSAARRVPRARLLEEDVMKKVFATFGFAAIVAAILAGCMSKSTAPTRTSTNPMPGSGAYAAAAVVRASTAGNVNGRAGEMPAFYDQRQVTINSIEKADNAAAPAPIP